MAVNEESEPGIIRAFGDEDCRALLRAMDTPETAKELATDCGLSLSSVYRKLDQLAETPLVEQSTRPRLRGKHPSQYRRTVDSLLVDVTARQSVGTESSADTET